jgi:hypothetical protein
MSHSPPTPDNAGGTTVTEGKKPTRREMELVLARQFGYEDFESFRAGVQESIGKAGLRKLEKELDKYGPAEAAEPDQRG